jgi:hypothetical protein
MTPLFFKDDARQSAFDLLENNFALQRCCRSYEASTKHLISVEYLTLNLQQRNTSFLYDYRENIGKRN